MAINLIKRFKKFERQILDYMVVREQTYFDSDCRKKLKTRYDRLKNSDNLKVNTGNNFKSRLVFPILKERMNLRRASIRANFRQDPIISLEPLGETDYENATNMQETLKLNLKHTKFRSKAWQNATNYLSKFGVAVLYSEFREMGDPGFKTVMTPEGPQRLSQEDREELGINDIRKNVVNYNIHPLNYFQNPQIADPSDSDFQGHIKRWKLSELVERANNAPDLYIRENLNKLIEEARDSVLENVNIHVDNESDETAEDESRYEIDISHYWGTINLKDNEDNNYVYYAEHDGVHIIRFQIEPYDRCIKPYNILLMDKKIEYWWGNTDAEYAASHENYMNLLINISADQTVQNRNILRFFQKGSIDTSDINNMHKHGGFIPMDFKNQPFRNVFGESQPANRADSDTNFMAREVKESLQGISTKPDLARPSAQGGFQNKTATAAQILTAQSDILEADFMEQIAFGLVQLGFINVVLLQQFLGESFFIRPDEKQPGMEIQKEKILGDFDYMIKSSLSKNKLFEITRLQNAITTLINYVGTGLPTLQNINIVKLVRDLIRNLEVGEVDEILPEQQAIQQQGLAQLGQAMPGMQGMGGQQGAIRAA